MNIRLLLVSLYACSDRLFRPQGSDAGPSVDTSAVPLAVKVGSRNSAGRKTISVTGSLLPDETVTVSNEVAGRVARIHIDFGQQVRQGDIVAERQAGASASTRLHPGIAGASACSHRSEPGQDTAVPETTPAIRQAQAQLEDARTRYESSAKLVKTGDIAGDRFVEVESPAGQRSRPDAARHELQTALASIRCAPRSSWRRKAADATIRAPFSGQVSERIASTRQYLRENTPIITLVKTNPLRLRVDIPESAAAAVRLGTALTLQRARWKATGSTPWSEN
jgi:multidrug efflux pump subunit AcrA (membrane-fusion protein)